MPAPRMIPPENGGTQTLFIAEWRKCAKEEGEEEEGAKQRAPDQQGGEERAAPVGLEDDAERQQGVANAQLDDDERGERDERTDQ